MSSAKPHYDAEFELRFMLEHAYEARVVEAYGSKVVLPDERKFGDLAGVQAYLDKVCDWLGLGPAPTAVYKRGVKTAHYNSIQRTIHLHPHQGSTSAWSMREIVVLHELAHHLSREEREDHGPVWAGAFVMLLEKCIAPEVGFLQRCAFGERGVALKTWETT